MLKIEVHGEVRYFLHKHIAAADPDRFYHYRSHFFEGESWELDPRDQQAFISEEVALHLRKFNRTLTKVSLAKQQMLPGTLFGETILQVVPAWPLKSFQASRDPSGRSLFCVSEALISEDYEFLRESREINGYRCHCLRAKNGSDAIWLSDNHPMTIVQRDLYGTTGELWQRIDALELAEVSSGIWLPRKFRTRIVSNRNTPNGSDAVTTTEFVSFSINGDVADTVFDCSLPPGTIELRESSQPQITPGGTDLLDDLHEYLTTIERLPQKQKRMDSDAISIFGLFLLGSTLGFLLVDTSITYWPFLARFRILI